MRDFINEQKPTLLDADRHWEKYKRDLLKQYEKKEPKKKSKKVIKATASA